MLELHKNIHKHPDTDEMMVLLYIMAVQCAIVPIL